MRHSFEETKQAPLADEGAITSRFLANVFLYVCLGLALSAVSALSFSWAMSHFYGLSGTDGAMALSDDGIVILAIVVSVSAILCYIDSLIMSSYSMRTHKASLVGYLIYALLIGIMLSVVLLAGVDFYALGIAFGLTALAFLASVLIGVAVKKINIVAYVAMVLGLSVMTASLFWLFAYLLDPQMGFIIDLGLSLALIALIMLITAIDVYRMKKIAAKDPGNSNLALFCATSIYCDLIMLFVRVLRVVALFSKNKR